MLVFDTICALATPPYRSALALIRLSGPKTKEVLSHVLKKDVDSLLPNQSVFTRIINKKTDEIVDEVVLTFYQGPKSYTGFDSADISIHGSMIIAKEVLSLLSENGARIAEPGEFSAQAYFNGKMDLLKAEGINDLINASSSRAKKIATETLSGKNSQSMTELKNKLLGYLSQMEYHVENQYDDNIDYYDEMDEINSSLKKDISSLNDTILQTKKANRQYHGFVICIAGEPNVGKSTLLNAILKEEKAIVSPIPGTTRDVVEGEKEINGILFRFKDTAGLRRTEDYVENLGIERSYKTIKESDIILLASDCGFASIDENQELNQALEGKPVIRISTKKDLIGTISDADISLCSQSDDLNPLIDLIFHKLDLDFKTEATFLGQREEDYLLKIRTDLEETSKAIDETHEIDIVSDTLRLAVNDINDLMGKDVNQTMEDIYQTLFSKFCLGK